jgi:NAD(P)-dependent dehydrogenase (short-subunit alcohol dehydrogenase family)
MGTSADLTGRTCLVTGANSGIGRATAIGLADRGATLLLAGRSASATQPVIDEITAVGRGTAEYLRLDLADLESVRSCAEEVLARDAPLHVLLNNAGVAGKKGVTAQGFELTFGVNHLGHFLLTMLLLDRLQTSGPARVVNVASNAHQGAKGIDFNAVRRRTRSFGGLVEYQVSKLCNVLFTQELARRLDTDDVTTYALHPGVVASNIWRHVPWPIRPVAKRFMISTTTGAETSIHCASSTDLGGLSGRYFEKCEEHPVSERCTPELAAELWARSTEWTS